MLVHTLKAGGAEKKKKFGHDVRFWFHVMKQHLVNNSGKKIKRVITVVSNSRQSKSNICFNEDVRYYVHMALVASERATGLFLVTPSGLISCQRCIQGCKM